MWLTFNSSVLLLLIHVLGEYQAAPWIMPICQDAGSSANQTALPLDYHCELAKSEALDLLNKFAVAMHSRDRAALEEIISLHIYFQGCMQMHYHYEVLDALLAIPPTKSVFGILEDTICSGRRYIMKVEFHGILKSPFKAQIEVIRSLGQFFQGCITDCVNL